MNKMVVIDWQTHMHAHPHTHQTSTSFKSPMRNAQSKASAHASNHRAPQGLSQRAVREMHHVSGLHLLHCGVHRGPHVLVKHVSFKCSSVHSCASLTCFPLCWHLYTRATTVHVKTCTLRSGTHPPPPVHAHTHPPLWERLGLPEGALHTSTAGAHAHTDTH